MRGKNGGRPSIGFVDPELRTEIDALLAANGFAGGGMHHQLRLQGVSSLNVKRLVDSYDSLYRSRRSELAERLALRDSFVCRFILGCDPSPTVRDFVVARLHELREMDPGVSMEPISRGEAQQLIHAVAAFSDEGRDLDYIRRNVGQKDT